MCGCAYERDISYLYYYVRGSKCQGLKNGLTTYFYSRCRNNFHVGKNIQRSVIFIIDYHYICGHQVQTMIDYKILFQEEPKLNVFDSVSETNQHL